MQESSNPHRANLPTIILFVLWSIALYLAFFSNTESLIFGPDSTVKSVRATDSVYVAISPLLALVSIGLVSSANKARLVFWRIKHALPGHRAFSSLALADPRIDMDKLRGSMDKWPESPDEENVVWYAIYRKYAKSSRVYESQKAFLLSRDIAVIAFLFSLFGTIGLALLGHQMVSVIAYLCATALEYTAFSLVAQNHARRFVCNVLAEFVADSR